MKLSHRNLDTIKRARCNAKPVCAIQINCEEVKPLILSGPKPTYPLILKGLSPANPRF